MIYSVQSKGNNRYNTRSIVMENTAMFCFQCQETAGNKGCTKNGVCGKTAEVANLQDMLVYVSKGLGEVLTEARKQGIKIEAEINHYVNLNLFTTITNANFDREVFIARILQTLEYKGGVMAKLQGTDYLSVHALYMEKDLKAIEEKARQIGILSIENIDIRSMKELITYGLKGLSAYLKHAVALGYDDENLHIFMQETLAKLLQDASLDELIGLSMKTGEMGVQAMALLDKANTETYGHPEITKVNIGVKNRPGILISGHDLADLEALLEQSKDSGVDIYTHSEMLPAHYYPKFKKYSHFVGNYGNAWWKQTEEFEKFNGPVLLTTNCLVPPKASYKDRVFTTGAAGFEGCRHIAGNKAHEKDFSKIIALAKTCQAPTELEQGEIVGGFAHNQVLALADKVVDAVKQGLIKKFVVMAGCDGRQKSREYYTDFAKALPKDTVILTAGCAKYKYNKLDLGDIAGIPRVLDAGQCNDCYSLAVIALKLKEAFGLEDINRLPLAFNIAWYEQKAVIVLLALLYLGVKNIHLGPTLPAFLSPTVAEFLVENFGIGTISDVENDLKILVG